MGGPDEPMRPLKASTTGKQGFHRQGDGAAAVTAALVSAPQDGTTCSDETAAGAEQIKTATQTADGRLSG